MGRQNPRPPDVILPEGWTVHYWGSAGFGTGALLGPDKEEILFPGYRGTGAMAEAAHEASPDSLYVSTILDRRRVDVAAKADGYLAVSYPLLAERTTGIFTSAFDFWTQTKTAQQAARALTIALTRLEKARDYDRDNTKAGQDAAFASNSLWPFENLGVSWQFDYGNDPKSGVVRFSYREEMSVELQRVAPPVSKWEEKTILLGRELRWGEDRSGHCWATATKRATFVSSSAKPQGIALAIMLALTYKPVGG